jgi:hypothetical protein
MTTTKDNNRQLRQSSTANDDDSSRVAAANSTSNDNDDEGDHHDAAPVVSQQHHQQQEQQCTMTTTALCPQDQEKKQKVSTLFNNDASSVTSEKKKAAYAGVPVSPPSDHHHQHQHVLSKQLDSDNIMIPQPDQIRQSPQEEVSRQNDDEDDDNQESSSSSNNGRNNVPGAYRVTPGSSSRISGGRRRNSRSSQSEITAAALEHYEAGFPGQVFFVPGESLLRPSLSRQQHQEEEEETTSQDDFGDNSSLPVAYSVNGDDGVIADNNTTSENDVLEELDRLGVPTIRNAVVIQEEVQEQAPEINTNNYDEDEENNIIPSAVVTNYAHHADPISTTSICCLPKEINRGTVKWISYIALLGIVAVISSIVAIIAYQRGGNTTATTDGITTTSTLLSQEEQDEIANRNYIQELISPLSSQEDLQDPTSPQSQAFNWLVNPETNINFYTHSHQDGFNWDSRIIERYVMAVLYYSTNGDNWTRNDWTGKILSLRGPASPICSWMILQCNPMILNSGNDEKEDGQEEVSLDSSKYTQTWAGRVVGINLGKYLFLPYFLLPPPL